MRFFSTNQSIISSTGSQRYWHPSLTITARTWSSIFVHVLTHLDIRGYVQCYPTSGHCKHLIFISKLKYDFKLYHIGQRRLSSNSSIIYGRCTELATKYHCVQCPFAGYSAYVRSGKCLETNIRNCSVAVHTRQSGDGHEHFRHDVGHCRCTLL